MGITLRKTLDQFYADLAKAITLDIQLKNINFNAGSSELLEESYTDLSTVIGLMKRNPKMKIELDGYADNLGDILKDKELSLDRVKIVKSYLVHHGIRARRIKTKAFGATKSISNDHSEESHRLNRRVEFVVIKK
jgi:OOP family OmpA-OmpF porin